MSTGHKSKSGVSWEFSSLRVSTDHYAFDPYNILDKRMKIERTLNNHPFSFLKGKLVQAVISTKRFIFKLPRHGILILKPYLCLYFSLSRKYPIRIKYLQFEYNCIPIVYPFGPSVHILYCCALLFYIVTNTDLFNSLLPSVIPKINEFISLLVTDANSA